MRRLKLRESSYSANYDSLDMSNFNTMLYWIRQRIMTEIGEQKKLLKVDLVSQSM